MRMVFFSDLKNKLTETRSKNTGARTAARCPAGKVSRSEKRKSLQNAATVAVSEKRSFSKLQNSEV